MALELESFNDVTLDEEYLTYMIDQLWPQKAQELGLLWDYYRNPMCGAVGVSANSLNENSRPYFQAQEYGLPPRITGITSRGGAMTDVSRKEVVIENDIAWRLHTMVDFLFGKAITIRSLAGDPATARAIEQIIAAMFDANNGTAFFQEAALLGSIYGFVDIAFRSPADATAWLPAPQAKPTSASANAPAAAAPAQSQSGADAEPAGRPGTPEKTGYRGPENPASAMFERRVALATAIAGKLVLEVIESPRVLPVLQEDDYRGISYWVQRFVKYPPRMTEGKRQWLGLGRSTSEQVSVEVLEIAGADWWQRYEQRQLVAQGHNVLGRPAVVHIQNMPLPGSYEGLSDVECLIPLQDELNTRLSDRANRVTYQSFKMYLGKGIEDFLQRPVGPGQMWATGNMDASIEEFGSDSGSPSEDEHIKQVRQAMDKVSGVTPLAAGIIGGNIGNLSSATALKVLLSGLAAKTNRKRLTYGAGISQVVAMALQWLDACGIFPTAPQDRRVEIQWPEEVIP